MNTSLDSTLAGSELTTGEMVMVFAYFAVLVLGTLIYLSTFVCVLVRSARRLHRSGRTGHPYLLAVVPMLAVGVGYGIWPAVVSGWLFAIGLALGYAVMFWDGRSWFRWTAVPMMLSLLYVPVGVR